MSIFRYSIGKINFIEVGSTNCIAFFLRPRISIIWAVLRIKSDNVDVSIWTTQRILKKKEKQNKTIYNYKKATSPWAWLSKTFWSFKFYFE